MSEDNVVDIDPNKLDEEWVDQPSLFHKYAKRLADAKQAHAEADRALDVIEAEVSLEIRQNPAKYKMEKVTEEGVKIRIVLHNRVKDGRTKLNDAKHKVDILQAMVTALDQRKTALENLVKLHGQDYFSRPVVSKETDDKVKTKLKDAETKKAFSKGRRA